MPPHPVPTPLPDPETTAQPRRRFFSQADKLRILADAEACTQEGQLSALLRREGLYATQLTAWRRLRTREGEAALSPKKPGPKSLPAPPPELERLQQENRRLQEQLQQATLILEIQKKLFVLLPTIPPSDAP